MTRKNLSLTLSCIVHLLIISGGVCHAFLFTVVLENIADITPVDSLVFIGESIKFSCKLHDTTLDVAPENMHFEIHNHPRNETWRVPMENTTVGSRTIYTEIEVTENFSSTTTVSCMAEKQLLHSTFLYVERPIQNITNFTGIYYYNKHIDLSWSLGETYLDINSIVVQVDWNPNRPPNENGNSCSSPTPVIDSCTIEQYTGQDIIFVRVAVNHKLKNKRPSAEFLQPLYAASATTVHKFVVDKYRKTQPPLNLKIVNKNSTCITITWDHPLYFASCNCNVIYQLMVTEKENKNVTHAYNGVRLAAEESIRACTLRPFRVYEVNIEIRADETNPWSDPASVEVHTDEDRPLSGPPMTDTSYHTGDCVNATREVILYWNDPLPESLQGKLTEFEITLNKGNISLRFGANHHKTDLDCESEYEIHVYSATKVGSSITPSEIVIPKKNCELPLLNDVMVRMEEVNVSSMTEKSVSVIITWEPGLLLGRNVTLVFYLCQEANIPYTCFNDFITKEISLDKKEMVLSNLQSSNNLFGYALRDDGGHKRHKRGIQWINCVYRAEIKPGKPSSVNVNVGNLANSLIISWTFSKCDRVSKALVLRYHLFICSQKNESLIHFCSTATVNSTESTYVAKDLKEGNTYYVYLQAESPAGMGIMSDPANGTTELSVTDQNLTSGSIIGIVMGVCVGVLFLSSVVAYFFRQCKQSKKQMEFLVVDALTILDNEGNGQHQGSQESGIETDSTPDSSSLGGLIKPPHLPCRNLNNVSYGDVAKQIAQAEASHPQIIRTTSITKTDNTKDMAATTPVLNSTVEWMPVKTTENLNDSTDVNMNCSKTVHSNSGNVIPYVMIANAGFSSVSDASDVVAVDEGYNSPGAVIDSPSFLEIVPQNVLVETNLPQISQQPQNVLVETNLPQISQQSQNVLMENKLSSISPQSQNVLMENKLSTISPQSQNVLKGSMLSSTSTSPLLYDYNIQDASSHGIQSTLPQLQSSASSMPVKSDHLVYSAQFDTAENELQMHKMKSSSSTFEEQNSTSKASAGTTESLENKSDTYKDHSPYQHLSQGYVTCTVDGDMKFDMADVSSETSSKYPQNAFSGYKPNDSTSQASYIQPSVMNTSESDESNNEAYKSIQFIEGTQGFGIEVGTESNLNDYLRCDDGQNNANDFNVQANGYVRQTYKHAW